MAYMDKLVDAGRKCGFLLNFSLVCDSSSELVRGSGMHCACGHSACSARPRH
jgi:hypothetical protein